MKTNLYSKTHSLVNLSSSILSFFNVRPFHPTIKEIDDILNTSNKHNVCVILFDALGKNVKHQHLNKNDSLIRHEVLDITSVFPPTTVSATNAFLSGKYPIENGWLGWRQRFNDLNVTIDMFSNTISYKNEKYKSKLSYERCSYTNIIELINNTSQYSAKGIFPDNIDKNGAKNIKHFFELIDNAVKGENKFTYAYFSQPDHALHDYGLDSIIVKNMIKDINKKVAKLTKNNPQTLFLIIADHGIVETTYYDFYEHKDLSSLVEFKPSIDSRALMIKIKENKIDEFELLFEKYYGRRDFILLRKDDIMKNQIFGLGTKHKEFDNFISDLIIISTSNKSFIIPDDDGGFNLFKSQHSGGTIDESLISVSIYNK